MAEQPTPNLLSNLTNREQEILVAALTKCNKGDIQIDYAKLATETGLKNAKTASAVWGPIKKKVFGVASPRADAPGGTANKVTKTPRKPKEPTTPKTPASTKKSVAKSVVKAEVEEEEEDVEAASDAEADETESEVKVEATEGSGANSHSAVKAETNDDDDATSKDADGDSPMIDTHESVDKGEVKVSIAEELSAGEMSPTAGLPLTKGKKAATPKANATPKTPRTPKTPTGEAAGTTPGDATETPVPGSSGAKKRGRKSKAQKEAEAAAAGENGTAANGDEDEGKKAAKKPRKTPLKKSKPAADAEDASTAGAGEGEEQEKPVKKPRKTPVKKEKKDDAAPNGDDSPAGQVVKEKKKPGPKPGATKGKKVEEVVEPSDVSGADTEQQKAAQEDLAEVVEMAQAANDVLDGKKIETKVVSTTTTPVKTPNWGTPVNSSTPVAVASEAVMESIEIDDEAGDTITVAN